MIFTRVNRHLLLACVAVLLFAQHTTSHAQVSVAAITFTPATIPSGGSTRLTIALGNTATGAATLVQPLTDVLPPGMQVVSLGAGSCSTTQVVATGSSITYTQQAAIPSGGCT